MLILSLMFILLSFALLEICEGYCKRYHSKRILKKYSEEENIELKI